MVEDVEVPKGEALLELTERLCESGRWENPAESGRVHLESAYTLTYMVRLTRHSTRVEL